jgi:hypothetical protein
MSALQGDVLQDMSSNAMLHVATVFNGSYHTIVDSPKPHTAA